MGERGGGVQLLKPCSNEHRKAVVVPSKRKPKAAESQATPTPVEHHDRDHACQESRTLRGLVGRVLFNSGGSGIEMELVEQRKFDSPVIVECDADGSEVTFNGQRMNSGSLLASVYRAFVQGRDVEFYSCETGYNYGVTMRAEFVTRFRH